MVDLRPLRQPGHHHRNADAAADVAHQVEQRRAFIAESRAARWLNDGDKGTKIKPSPSPGNAGAYDVDTGDVGGEQCHFPQSE